MQMNNGSHFQPPAERSSSLIDSGRKSRLDISETSTRMRRAEGNVGEERQSCFLITGPRLFFQALFNIWGDEQGSLE
jgi:hypothetical protein